MQRKYSVVAIIALQTLSFHAYATNRNIVKSDYGVEWPFTVDSGILRCSNNQVTFLTGGVEYAVNGSAKSAGYVPMEPVWKYDIELIQQMADNYDITLDEAKLEFTFRISVGPIIKSGLELC